MENTSTHTEDVVRPTWTVSLLIRAEVREVEHPDLVLGTRRHRPSEAIGRLEDLFPGVRAQSDARGLPQGAERRCLTVGTLRRNY